MTILSNTMPKLLLIFISILTLIGCSSTPPAQIALNPAAPIVKPLAGELPTLQLTTLDTRSANFIVRFNRDEKAAKLISPAVPPRAQLETIFNQAFLDAGYTTATQSETRLELQLSNLLSDVSESSFGYKAEHIITIDLIAQQPLKVLTKTYRAKGTLEGPFSTDVAAIELELNQLLGQLTANIVNDPELNQFLQQL